MWSTTTGTVPTAAWSHSARALGACRTEERPILGALRRRDLLGGLIHEYEPAT
jgi:hypothetical protein